jgi:hypothetical protein
LVPVSEVAAGIKALKADSSLVVVASIQGPPTPYQIGWTMPGVTTDGPWPEILHSCTLGTGDLQAFADPGVRLAQFTQSFGANGLVYSICQENYGPALNTIAMKVAQTMNAPACIAGPFVDKDRNPANGVQPDCVVFHRLPRVGTSPLDTPVSACAESGNAPPCWSLSASAMCAAGESQLIVNHGGAAVPEGLLLVVKCETCTPGISDPAAGCP